MGGGGGGGSFDRSLYSEDERFADHETQPLETMNMGLRRAERHQIDLTRALLNAQIHKVNDRRNAADAPYHGERPAQAVLLAASHHASIDFFLVHEPGA